MEIHVLFKVVFYKRKTCLIIFNNVFHMQASNKLNPKRYNAVCVSLLLSLALALRQHSHSVMICLELIPSHAASVVIGGGVFGANPSLQCQPSHRKVVAKQRTSVENLLDPVIGQLVLRGSEDQIFKSHKQKDRKGCAEGSRRDLISRFLQSPKFPSSELKIFVKSVTRKGSKSNIQQFYTFYTANFLYFVHSIFEYVLM